MSFQPSEVAVPVRQLAVFRAETFCVSHGVNQGEPLTDASELLHDDIYMLNEEAQLVRLAVAPAEGGSALCVGPDSATGQPGAPLYLDSLLTFMDASGETREVLVFVEVDAHESTISQVYLYPLAALVPKSGYALVTIDREAAPARLAATAAIAFMRGTRITMAGGQQVAIEALEPGDRVLTRDSGIQQVRWTGMQTLRATGAFAPITIAAGALNNTADLVVSPNHRLFIYQRVDALKAGRKELLVKAGLLVNGTTVTQEPGGFVDYFQVLFDKHEIIYAEGIAAESLFVDPDTRSALPEDVASRLRPAVPSRHPLGATELHEADLKFRSDAAELLRRVSAM